MATLNTSKSNADEGLQQYPYPSHVNAASFVSIKLSDKANYARWKEQMLCLLDSHDMIGFIDGTLEKPQESSDSKLKASMATFEEAKCREWKRSDTLVKGWIFGSVSEDVMGIVLGLKTSNDVWNELKKKYEQDSASTPTQIPAQTATRDPATPRKTNSAYVLLKAYPELARTKPPSESAPIKCIAQIWDAYPSAKQYNFYQRFIYSHIQESYGLDETYNIQDVENQETTYSRKNLVPQSRLYSVIKRIYVKLWEVAQQRVPHIKQIHEDKVKHNTTLMILKFICEEVVKLESSHEEHYVNAFVMAVKNDTPEVLRQISQTFPQAIWSRLSNDNYTLSQLSIINRCEKAYNFLVHDWTHDKYLHSRSVDNDGNNLLHLAGRLAPPNKLNMVTGAALQMQRELQWFQEVRKFIRPKETEALNKNGETPMMVFRKEHKNLRKDGEEWIKKTADSYTITAALIITIVFAAAITVPGGNNGGTGKAIFESNPGFIVFVVSDAISLFTSTTSLLLFLSILTARYAEEDFLYKIPKRLILGLVMLFMSVTTMVLAFSATLYISFGQGKSWILIPVGALTCLPIASFVTLQLSLLVDLYSSTYGRGIFVKGSELRITS